MVGLQVPKSGDDLKAVVNGVAASSVNGVAASSALWKDLPVLDPGNDVLDAGADASVRPVVVVAEDAPSGPRHGLVMVVIPRYRPSPRIVRVPVEWVSDGVTGHDDVVAVAGPAVTDWVQDAPFRAGECLCVDAAPVVLADRGDRLVVHGDQSAVDDPRSPGLLVSGRSATARIGTRWWMIRSAVDWLVRRARSGHGWSGRCAGESRPAAAEWAPTGPRDSHGLQERPYGR